MKILNTLFPLNGIDLDLRTTVFLRFLLIENGMRKSLASNAVQDVELKRLINNKVNVLYCILSICYK